MSSGDPRPTEVASPLYLPAALSSRSPSLPDGLAVASLPHLSWLKLGVLGSFWRHATQETRNLAVSIFLPFQPPPDRLPELPGCASGLPHRSPPRGFHWAPSLPRLLNSNLLSTYSVVGAGGSSSAQPCP